eukprot:SAG31_NODE_1773_length_7304_cov_2.180380_7_plen_117_part_00
MTDEKHTSITFVWQGQQLTFFPSNGDGLPGNKFCRPPKCAVQLPQIDGITIDVSPSKVYSGPHLSSELGSNSVTTQYTKDFRVVYDFNSDSITTTAHRPTNVAQTTLKTDNGSVVV